MKTAKKLLLLCMLTGLPASLYAGEKDDLQKKLAELQTQRETAETAYLQSKYNFIDEKQKARDELTVLESKVKDLLDKRSRLKEDIQNLKKDKAEIDDHNSTSEMRLSDINASYLSFADRLSSFVKLHAPITSDAEYQHISALRDAVEQRKNIQTTGENLIDFTTKLIKKTQTSEFVYGDILDDKGGMHKGTRVRLGGVFYGYAADDGYSQMLLRTNSGGYAWNSEAGNASAIDGFINAFRGKDEIAELPIDVMQSYSTAKAVGGGSSFLGGFFAWFRSGGIVMYAILIVLIFAVYIIIERTRAFKNGRIAGESVIEPVLGNLQDGKQKEALDICRKHVGAEPRLLGALIETPAKTDDEGYDRMQAVMLEEIPRVEKRLSTLKSLGALAPLLGLLGTVTGMISLFDVITAVGTGDPKLLAGGISEALVTTEFGLIVAIPAVLAYRLLQNKADDIIGGLERSGLLVLNELRQNKKTKA